MASFKTVQIRNLVLVGHQGSGKTSLAESLLYVGGSVHRLGSVGEGNTTSDYHPSEKERQMSIFSSLLHTQWRTQKINVIDTPGYPDFVGEVAAAMNVADTAVFVLHAAEDIEVGTELAWAYAEVAHKPSLFVINQTDRRRADTDTLVERVRQRFGSSASVVQFLGTDPRAVIDVLIMKQLTYDAGEKQPTVSDIPAEFQDRAEELHNALVEDIAVNDEELMELYFEQGELTEKQMRQGLRAAMRERALFPIFCAVAVQNVGTSRLLDFACDVCPPPFHGTTIPNEPLAMVYRTMAEQHVGDYSFLRVYGGVIESGMDMENARTTSSQRLGQLYALNGRERASVPQMVAGDLGALVKLRDTHTNDTLRKKGSNVVLPPITFPAPRYHVSIRPTTDGEEDKLAQGLHQITAEDPSLVVNHDPHLSQVTLGGQGELHLRVAQYRLRAKVNVEVEFSRPRVAYRETVTAEARSSYRHKKQTGGAGQFADISVLIEPLDGEFQKRPDISVRKTVDVTTGWGSTIQFIDGIVGGVIDMRRFFGAIQKGVLEAMQRGPVAGYPVGNVRLVIYDGGMHSVDSNEAAFRSAARMSFRYAFRSARPVILEPVHEVWVTVPESDTGDIIGDMNTRRARIQGIEAEGRLQKIKAQIPEAELYRYSTAVRSMTQGRGIHESSFSHYEAMPRHVQEEVINKAQEDGQ